MGSESRVGSEEPSVTFEIREIQRQRKTNGLRTCKIGLALLGQRSGDRSVSVVR